MRFWDSSAVVPLLVDEAASDLVLELAQDDPAMLVWWATEIECVSAVARLERQDDLSSSSAVAALERLSDLVKGWSEVQPVDSVKRTAVRLLRMHSLRGADALQLAAAIVACEGHPTSIELVTCDRRLIDAAQREGLLVREGI